MDCDVRWRVPRDAYYRVSDHGLMPAEYLVYSRYVHWNYVLHNLSHFVLIWRYFGNIGHRDRCEVMRDQLLYCLNFDLDGNCL